MKELFKQPTAENLVTQLCDELEIILEDLRRKCERFKVYGQALPQNLFYDDDDDDTYLPCCLVKITEESISSWTQPPTYTVSIGIVINMAQPDGLGTFDVLSAFERIKQRFSRNAYIGNFEASPPVRIVSSDEEEYPYYGGDMTISFIGRRIEREDPLA